MPGVVVGGGSGGICGVRRSAAPRAYPACLLRSHAPLSLGAKGAETWGVLRSPAHVIPDRHTSFLRRQESTAPFVFDERGANGVSGVCTGWMWRATGGSAGVRRSAAPGIPRVLASLARAPFAGSERGREVFARS